MLINTPIPEPTDTLSPHQWLREDKKNVMEEIHWIAPDIENEDVAVITRLHTIERNGYRTVRVKLTNPAEPVQPVRVPAQSCCRVGLLPPLSHSSY